MKKTIRREPVPLVLWTPRQLHLMQPGRQQAALKQNAVALRRHSEYRPRPEPGWVAKAYEEYWNGEEGA